MIRVIVSGICGRMGSRVARAIAASDDLSLVGGVEASGHDMTGRSLCGLRDGAVLEVPVRPRLSDLEPSSYDVIVDFSVPAQALACARAAAAAEAKGLVIGTTGLSVEEIGEIRRASERCAIVLAPNASVGMNVLFGLVRRTSEILDRTYDVEIVETHHSAKRDAPSGTAARLAEIVCEARGLDPRGDVSVGRSGRDAVRRAGEVGVHSVRGGAVVGQHVVRFISDLEEITVAHEAFSRDAFAGGAAAAARFVARQPPGLYDMLDVLALKGGGREASP